jgi:hypothetical protein
VAAKVTETGRALASAPAVASARAQATAAFAPIASRVAEGASNVAAAAGPTVLRAQSVAANAVSGVAAGAQQVAASAQRLMRGRDGGETVDSGASAAVALPPRAYEASFNAADATSAPEAADFSIEEDDATGMTPKGVAEGGETADDAESSSPHTTTAERLAALQLRASVAASALSGRVSAAATEVASRVRETSGAIANLPAVQQAATTAGGGIKAAAAAASRLRREVALTPAVQNAQAAVNHAAGRAAGAFSILAEAAKKIAQPPFGNVGQTVASTAATSGGAGLPLETETEPAQPATIT